MRIFPAIAVGLAIVVSGCSYSSQAPVSPAYNVYSNYDDKLPGSYALYVDADAMTGTYSVQGFDCAVHRYPVDARGSFKTSVHQTFQNLVENVELVDAPLSTADLQARGHRGQIIVEGQEMDVKLVVIPGFFMADMEADVEVAANMRVDDDDGQRMLGTTVAADKDAISEADIACSGGADAITAATSEAFEELMQRLGERLSNSRKLREQEEGTARTS